MNKNRVIAIVIFLACFSILFPSTSRKISYVFGQVSRARPIETNYTLIVTMFDWLTQTPVSNVSFIMTVNETEISGITNSTGAFSYRWVAEKKESIYMFVRRLALGSNYTVIRICSTMISTPILSERALSLSYIAYYSRNQTYYRDILANLWTSIAENETTINCQIWIEKGKAVKISSYDPAKGKIQLYVNPGLPVIGAAPTNYEDWYFVPIDYPITIMDPPDFEGRTRYSPLIVTIGKNTEVINWTYHATVEFYTNKLKTIEQRLVWYDYQGLPLTDERRDYLQTVVMFEQSSNLIGMGNYSMGLNYLAQAENRYAYVNSELDNVDNYIKMTTLLIILFSYGFSRFIPSLFVENEKRRMIVSIAIYYGLLTTFTLTQPYIKITLAMVIGSLTGYANQSTVYMDPLMMLTTFFVLSTFIFLLIFAISLLRPLSFAGFIMDIAMRNMKARKNRTLLTVVTVALIVGGSVAFVNISSGRGVVETGSWTGTSKKSLIVEPRDTGLTDYQIKQYEALWLKDQSWAKDLSYEEPLSGRIMIESQFFMMSVDILKGPIYIAQGLSGKTFDPNFYQKYYNLSRYLIGTMPTSKERGILLSWSIPGVRVGDVVELQISLFRMSEPPVEIKRSIGIFEVKGLLDPEQISNLKRLDGKPLFEDPNKLILAPNGVMPSDVSQIRQVTVVTTEDADVQTIAKQIAFMFGHAVTANADGRAVNFQEIFTFSVAGGLAQIIPILIAGLLTYNIVSATVLERKRDISTIAVLGANPTNVTQIFMAEMVVLGFISTLVGFFGSYFLNLLVSIGASLLDFLGIRITGVLPPGRFSLSAVVVALFSGVFVTFIAGLIPVIRVQNISLMSRIRRKVIPLEAKRVGLLSEYELPLRVPSLDGEMLFDFLKEVFEKRMRDIDAKYDLYQDGTFQVNFSARGWAIDVAAVARCTIRVDRRGESLYMILIFPDVLRDSKQFQEFLYKLERNLMNYTTWREARVRIKIVREAVSAPRIRTLEDIINDLRALQQQIDEIGEKLEKLESMRAKISTTVYTEFENRYKGEMSKLIKKLRPLGMELEPYRESLRKEIRELTMRVEKLSASYNLGEISKEEYSEQIGPLESRLKELRSNSDRIEELFRQLKARVPT